MPLPTPSQLSTQLTEIIAQRTSVDVSWAQHPQPLTLTELLLIKREVAVHFNNLVADITPEVERK